MRAIRRHGRGGFTLIELLTVIAIIAILAALVMTAVISAQESGKVANCKNNLLQLNKLIYMYSTTYGSYLPAFWHERWVGELDLVGRTWGTLADDVNPKVPTVWNNFSPASKWLGHAGFPIRTGSSSLVCKSDLSGFRCDQGAFVSYLGLAKYGWWHRGGARKVEDGSARGYHWEWHADWPKYEYHQIQEVDNPTRRLLLAETEPGTWQYGGCG